MVDAAMKEHLALWCLRGPGPDSAAGEPRSAIAAASDSAGCSLLVDGWERYGYCGLEHFLVGAATLLAGLELCSDR